MKDNVPCIHCNRAGEISTDAKYIVAAYGLIPDFWKDFKEFPNVSMLPSSSIDNRNDIEIDKFPPSTTQLLTHSNPIHIEDQRKYEETVVVIPHEDATA